MILKRILLYSIILHLLNSCAEYSVNNKKEKVYYSSAGFTLIYEEKFFDNKIINKKINNENIVFIHNILRNNTSVKIINPINSKTIITKVHKKANFPKIFNSVISKKISDTLELDTNNPYIEIYEIKKNKIFIAKKSNTFDEEKTVANKAPVDTIEMDDLQNVNSNTNTKSINEKSFILVINDFYYQDSANSLKKDLQKKSKLDNIFVKKINNNQFRLSVGPFKNFNALKTSYIRLNNLGFEDLNIYID
jgi:hypothetical protein